MQTVTKTPSVTIIQNYEASKRPTNYKGARGMDTKTMHEAIKGYKEACTLKNEKIEEMYTRCAELEGVLNQALEVFSDCKEYSSFGEFSERAAGLVKVMCSVLKEGKQ